MVTLTVIVADAFSCHIIINLLEVYFYRNNLVDRAYRKSQIPRIEPLVEVKNVAGLSK